MVVEFFRNRPSLAPELLREALHVDLPNFTEVQIYSADLTDVQPTEYRADLVLRLVDGTEVLGVVVEVQLSPDRRKRFVWPVYVATLRARLECPVCLLVVTVEEAIARWAAQVIEMGGGRSSMKLRRERILNWRCFPRWRTARTRTWKKQCGSQSPL